MTTTQQLAAIAARGNVLVAAGAGTGKTSTVTERCLDLIVRERCPLSAILMVTFTDAAAAEMRERIRHALHQAAEAAPRDSEHAHWLAEQNALLETAPISTLHGFCLELVRRNFHTLGLDPQFTVLDEQQTKPLIHSVLDALFQKHYGQASDHSRDVAELVRGYGAGRDDAIRQLVLKIHQHAQTLAAPTQWLTEQIALFNNPSADNWRTRFVEGVLEWASYWQTSIDESAEGSANLAACAEALQSIGDNPTICHVESMLAKIAAADEREWDGTKGKVRKPVESFFAGAAFLRELTANDGAPLAEDWEWSRRPMLALLELVREFGDEFARAKRELGGIDFSDQEQFALRLLLDAGQPTDIARACRERFRYVFVDECQDINAAQDAILRAVSREGADANRFLVGDVKQSIYRFRLADPRIFQEYQERWSRGEPVAATPTVEPRELQFDFFSAPAPPMPVRGKRKPAPVASAPVPVVSARTLSLTENFRSREALLQFINPVFRALMRPVIGGLTYDAAAQLQFGNRKERLPLTIAALRERPPNVESHQWPAAGEVTPRVELHVLTKDNDAESSEELFENDPATNKDVPDLQATEREALLVARRLKQLRDSGHRIWRPNENAFAPVEYRDMVVLMRSAAGRAEVFARTFHREGIPLHAGRAGFLEAQEVRDVLNLLRLLDNPLQDLPLLGVLRSPFVGLSPEELVQLRLAEPNALLWTGLLKLQSAEPAEGVAFKARTFVSAFQRWRELIRHTSLTHCIECALTETHYEALLLASERGPERVANLRQLVDLARRFDPFQRAGLFRFLQFIAEQEEAEARHEPAELFNENAVRLMTIHASKGLEFPVVVLAGLGARFNMRDLGNDILLHEDLGLCPKVLPPDSRTRYPSIVHWLAAQRERRALLGEELRLLYVAMTRARDTLILTGAASRKDEITRWEEPSPINDHALTKASCFLDWLRLWFTNEGQPLEWQNDYEGANELLRWRFYFANDAAFASQPTDPNTGALGLQPPSSEELLQLRSRIGSQYEHVAATREAAKTSVTTLRRRATEADEEARPLFQFNHRAPVVPGASDKLSAAEIGTAHHAFLQFVDLMQVGSEATLHSEATRLFNAGGLTEYELAALDFAALAAFWNSEVGQSIRAAPPKCINREMPFTARFGANELGQLIGGIAGPDDAGDFVIVQGALDLAVLLPDQIWLLDFKTDKVSAGELAAKADHYKPQLKIYSTALARIYNRPVTRCWLHFLAAQKTVSLAVS